MVPRRTSQRWERTTTHPSPYSASEASRPAVPEGRMQRDLVERARTGDHDAFAELAGAAISRLDAAAWLILRDAEQAKDAVQNALVRAWRDLPTLRDPDRFDAWIQPARWSVPASMRRAGSDAIASMSSSPRFPLRRSTAQNRSSSPATRSNAASSGSIRRCVP